MNVKSDIDVSLINTDGEAGPNDEVRNPRSLPLESPPLGSLSGDRLQSHPGHYQNKASGQLGEKLYPYHAHCA